MSCRSLQLRVGHLNAVYGDVLPSLLSEDGDLLTNDALPGDLDGLKDIKRRKTGRGVLPQFRSSNPDIKTISPIYVNQGFKSKIK